ncbi:hypothetical protein F3087_15160 [Nocardia colli]|uniref:Phospholipase n=1 Tax=Nocardia colli TaxID=2545717 RepID=A0A5N0EIB7_9NOCA|nr:hypothetical protein [Nocardia colli]KAA8888369.1 hypothetical protein F3087_15160 [Nocardia colli]
MPGAPGDTSRAPFVPPSTIGEPTPLGGEPSAPSAGSGSQQGEIAPTTVSPQPSSNAVVPALPRPQTTPAKSDMGSITVPPGYIYDPDCTRTPNCEKARHDYCTGSPDQTPMPGTNADFSGACARHDMCYDAADKTGQGYGACNTSLYDDMKKVCSDVYKGYDPRRVVCYTYAETYWVAVTASHGNKL